MTLLSQVISQQAVWQSTCYKSTVPKLKTNMNAFHNKNIPVCFSDSVYQQVQI